VPTPLQFASLSPDIHKQLEKKIAEFHGKEDAILYGSAFDANAGIFEAILTPEVRARMNESASGEWQAVEMR
jgi:7-keto-8-aminopelargonate synthetase-like enzyme